MQPRPRFLVYIAQSLDGYIARPDGGLDWLEGHDVPEGEDFGYHAFMARVDALVMGRNSFESVLSFDVPWPYGETHVYVLTSRPLQIPEALRATVSAEGGAPAEVAARLAAAGVRAAYLDGGATIQRFLRAGLVDELIVTTIPVLLGEGIPLFGALEADQPLELVGVTGHEGCGFVVSRYEVPGLT